MKIVLAICACVALAHAQPVIDAEAHYRSGVTLFNDGKFDAALAEFEASYAAAPKAGVLFNIGLTHQRLFHVVEAIATFRRFLAEAPDAPAEKREEARQLVEDLEKLIAEITLTVTPTGARIAIDQREVGVAPLEKPVTLASGPHAVDVSMVGYQSQHREIAVAGGVAATHVIDLAIVPKPVEPPPIVIAPARPEPREESRWYTKWYVWAPVVVVAVGVTALAIAYRGDDHVDGTLGGSHL